ncbi:hypothetical protein MUY14_07270 [Amycolatopsis sp. FBCC-B4732]|uniref:hypothetical protein n=1 Tax=Amycolatopsis sp. FBCC-B4732 TaxID=3079339 RepID=UPI001FF5AB12|nr:hypothetical protein [Amycolatopsis sp. FBCC-B4732]UOX90417.1 hypothetical protein MUY14_07270 [Amycolatopsis sp. FBCC-B4732]
MAQITVAMLALFAQMERTFMLERAADARAALEARGGSPGRPRKLPDDALRTAKAAVDAGMDVTAHARLSQTLRNGGARKATVRAAGSRPADPRRARGSPIALGISNPLRACRRHATKLVHSRL